MAKAKIDRAKIIREIIEADKYVNLQALVNKFGVSESTVRRDLALLEEEGILKRNHGGAVLVDSEPAEQDITDFKLPIPLKNDHLKKAIAAEASKLVNDGDFIVIGSGTTCLEFARCLKSKNNVTILTNNIYVALELSFCNNIHLIMASGIATHNNNCSNVIGDYALDFLSQFHPEKAFCSVLAVDFLAGYYDLDFKLRSVLDKMVDVSDRSYLLLDHTKFNKRGRIKIGDLNRYDEIITTPGIPEEFLKYYEEAGIPVHISSLDL